MNYNIIACILFIILIFTLFSYVSMSNNKEGFSTGSSLATWIIIVQDVKLNLELSSSINGRVINLQEMIAYDAADAGGNTINNTDYDSLTEYHDGNYPASKLFDGTSDMYHSQGYTGQDTQWIWGKYNSRPKSIKINNRSSSNYIWNHRINFAKVYLTHTEPNINKSSTNDIHNHTSSWTLLYTFPGTGTVSGADTNRVVGSVQPVNNTFSTTINIPADTTAAGGSGVSISNDGSVTIEYIDASSLPDTYDANTTYNLDINIQTIPRNVIPSDKRQHFTGTLTIGNSVTSIGSVAFYGCSGFTGNLIIPNSVRSIGESAFYGCSGFTGDLTIGNSVQIISQYAFHACSGFTGNLIIPNSVESVERYAFTNCSGFTGNLIIPNRVTSIGDVAFYGCSGFTGNLIIPNSVTSIGEYAFSSTNFNKAIVQTSDQENMVRNAGYTGTIEQTTQASSSGGSSSGGAYTIGTLFTSGYPVGYPAHQGTTRYNDVLYDNLSHGQSFTVMNGGYLTKIISNAVGGRVGDSLTNDIARTTLNIREYVNDNVSGSNHALTGQILETSVSDPTILNYDYSNLDPPDDGDRYPTTEYLFSGGLYLEPSTKYVIEFVSRLSTYYTVSTNNYDGGKGYTVDHHFNQYFPDKEFPFQAFLEPNSSSSSSIRSNNTALQNTTIAPQRAPIAPQRAAVASSSSSSNYEFQFMTDNQIKNEITNCINNLSDITPDKISQCYGNQVSTRNIDINIDDPKDLNNMFNNLDKLDDFCEIRNNRQSTKQLNEETKILEKSKDALDIQQERINDLKTILNELRKKQIKNDIVDKKCQQTNQEIINSDYDMVTQLSTSGLLKDNSINIDLNVSDELKKINLIRNTNAPTPTISEPDMVLTNETPPKNIDELIEGSYSVPLDKENYVSSERIEEMYAYCGVDKQEYIDINELQYGVCQGCNKDMLKDKIEIINTDFK